MRILFMGSASISCRALETLLADKSNEVVAAVTQPDRPKGRSLKESACPARAVAEARGVRVLAPPDVNTAECISSLVELKPDVIAVVAYGQLLSQQLLDIPKYGCINLHASLLPKYRGAAPIQWAIANGEKATGVTIMHMARKMDAGDIIMQEGVPIADDDTGASLQDKLAAVGAPLLLRAIGALSAGNASRVSQVEADATYAHKLKKEHGHIDWTLDALAIYNRIRAFNPWPCCFARMSQGTSALRILAARIAEGSGAPGTVLEASGEGPLIAAGNKALLLTQVQPEGRKAMNGAAYLNGHALKKGDRLI